MGWLENVIFKNQELANERLELADKNALYYLSTGLTLRNCTVILKVPASRLIIKQACFINCTFEVKQQLNNHQSWVYASLKGCRFKGRFSGCDFGHWPDYSQGAEHGSLEDCDFTEARLDACRFHGCDMRTLRLPRWPCFTLLEPHRHASALRGVQWPGTFGDVAVAYLHEHPESSVALSFHAPTAARFFKTTEEELKAAIERFDCFVY
jgi:uncharacterized protein YjbI with pentapeptide repeats